MKKISALIGTIDLLSHLYVLIDSASVIWILNGSEKETETGNAHKNF